MSKKRPGGEDEGWERISHVVHHFIGEVCCVTSPISAEDVGRVRIWGSDFPAKADVHVARGRWVRVLSHDAGVLNVAPLNVWLGSCGC